MQFSKTLIFDTSRFNSESQRFLRFKLCQRSSQLLWCRNAAPFSDLRRAHWHLRFSYSHSYKTAISEDSETTLRWLL
jgi:hypothetical protein